MSKKRRKGGVPSMNAETIFRYKVPEYDPCDGCPRFYKGVERDKEGQVIREFNCRTLCRKV